MRRSSRASIALLLAGLLLPALACAQQGATLKFSWDHCAGDGYVGDRSFACNTNTGSESLFASVIFTDGVDRTEVAFFGAHLDIQPLATQPPPWWQTAMGECRAHSIAMAPGPPAATPACAVWSGPGNPITLDVFRIWPTPVPGGVALRVELGSAVPSGSEARLDAGIEYLLFQIRLGHSKSTGATACAGCLVPACIGFGDLYLDHPSPEPRESYAGSITSTVTWQGAYVESFTPVPGQWGGGGYNSYGSIFRCSSGPVSTRNKTWGMIKSFYR